MGTWDVAARHGRWSKRDVGRRLADQHMVICEVCGRACHRGSDVSVMPTPRLSVMMANSRARAASSSASRELSASGIVSASTHSSQPRGRLCGTLAGSPGRGREVAKASGLLAMLALVAALTKGWRRRAPVPATAGPE